MGVASIISRIPYLQTHDLDISASEGGVRVRMPLKHDVTNHVGIVHAGALFTAAETAAGVASFGIAPNGSAVVLLRAANVRYTRRAEGDVVAVAHVAGEVADAAREAFEEGGRADARVEVTAEDPAGEKVFEGTFDYALRRRSA